jgi:solute carrier family 25 ornithine transporter 2/15/solute carrier family 25 carnitine/acylcarnitine transporter 20/29
MRGFFTGLPALLMRDVPFNALFFGSYRTLCRLCAFTRMHKGWGRYASSSISSRADGTSEDPEAVYRITHDHLSPGEYFVCGGMAGMAAWSVIFPFDSIKSRMQSGAVKTGMVDTIVSMWRKGGATPFFRGWSAAVLRAFPANAALFLGVEMSRKMFRSIA